MRAPRPVRQANADDYDHWHDGLGDTVFEPSGPDHVGLLDKDGNPLVRERRRIGFDLRRRAE